MKMRPYQYDAQHAGIAWVRKNVEPCVLELPTGAGKSIIIAEIANTLHKVSGGKHILCIVPSKELLEQNAEKIRLTGNAVSLFSASVGETCLKHPLVVGTPVSIKNKINQFGNQFCAVIIDECHRITPTIIAIIEQLQVFNERLRVIGLSATPYRMNTGYIYKVNIRDEFLHESKAKDPYFHKLVYKISAQELIQQGYLCPPVIGAIHSGHYETKDMQLNNMGSFSKEDIDRAYHGQGRLTSDIVADVIAQSKNRHGVIFFAATVQHAEEILASLPASLSEIVTGGTPAGEREIILLKFKAQRIKYLVNVSVLTTGFDAPHCDVIALLRATESASLLQQMIGRGLRLSDEKENCLVLDYAENFDRHFPDGDVFNPDIKTIKSKDGEIDFVKARCPKCHRVNLFVPRPNPDGFPIDDNGYCVDLRGDRVVISADEDDFYNEDTPEEDRYLPAHYGRACQSEYCDYRWVLKVCGACHAENDITARYCHECKEELVDPNKKLVKRYQERKSDPYQMQTDEVINMLVRQTISKAGNDMLRVEFVTKFRTFTVFFTPKFATYYNNFMSATKNGTKAPHTITYQKEGDFYKVFNYNARPLDDEIPPLA
jgi:DNA repair protein RadD